MHISGPDEEREREARASKRDLARVLDSLNEMIMVFDTELRVVAIHGQRFLGVTQPDAQILGRTAPELLPPGVVTQIGDALRRVIEGGAAERRPVRTNDTTFRLSVTPLRTEDARVAGVTCVFQDVTEQEAAHSEREAARVRADEMQRAETIGRLVSGIAHEINNPLAAIITFAEQLRMDARTAVDAAALDAIHSEAVRSRAVVRDLLAYVRVPDDRAVTPVRPGPLLDDLLKSLVPHVASLGVELTWDRQDEGVWVAADVAGLEQVVTNLVINGAEAAGAGGRVVVRTPPSQDAFTIIVDDTGAGIAASVIPYVFQPFFSTKTAGRAMGLGLFVARGIVQRLGGTLTCENRLEGGARFVVELRRALPPAEATPNRAMRAVPEPAAVNARVLLVDDEDSIRVSLKRFFVRRGWQVFEARDGESALATLRTEDADSFALMLCDLRMPGMGGAELHSHIKREFPRLLPRLILVSGDVVSASTAAFIAQCGCEVLEKPFELRQLGALADDRLATLHGRQKGGAA